jgi:hypothetical protein
MKQLVSLFALFSREKVLLRLKLVGACSVNRGGNNTEPLNGLGRPGREREYPEECTLICGVHDAKKHEGNNTSDGRVLLFEAGENARENRNEVIHFVFIFWLENRSHFEPRQKKPKGKSPDQFR